MLEIYSPHQALFEHRLKEVEDIQAVIDVIGEEVHQIGRQAATDVIGKINNLDQLAEWKQAQTAAQRLAYEGMRFGYLAATAILSEEQNHG